jgi:hypothetical protein
MTKFAVGFLAVACAVTLSAFGQNKVVFDNQSGDPALVKLIGPTQTEVEVPNGAKVGTGAAGGHYVIKVRYGTPGNYRYSKGDEFTVTETAAATSETTITLHKVVAGNYESRPISEDDFGATVPRANAPKANTTVTHEASQRVHAETESRVVSALVAEVSDMSQFPKDESPRARSFKSVFGVYAKIVSAVVTVKEQKQERQAVTALIPLLKKGITATVDSDNAWTAAHSALALEDLGPEGRAALPVLKQLATHPDRYVSSRAERALAKIQGVTDETKEAK